MPAAARDQITLITGMPEAPPASAPPARPRRRKHWRGNGRIPVPEVLTESTYDDEPRREPPPSTWFDDLDSGPCPGPGAQEAPGA